MKRLKQVLLIGFLCGSCGFGWAQDLNRQTPDLQTAQPDFFDPTRQKPEEVYQFSTQWRLEVGFAQWSQRTSTLSYPDVYLNGGRIGGTVDFILPKHFSVQTGLLATLTTGNYQQHWRSMDEENTQIEILKNQIVQLELTIPARVYYNVTLWKQLRMFFYTGPQLQVGLVGYDIITNNLNTDVNLYVQSLGYNTESHDRYAEKELYRTSIQWGLGGGLEWDKYRLQGGYDFGLNNLAYPRFEVNQHLWEWGWMVSFAYLF